MTVPPAFTVQTRTADPDSNTVTINAVVETATVLGTDWPYGCRWCGRSTKNDAVEICEQLQGVVHSDCHEDECGACAHLLCTEERCDFRDECDDCCEAVCHRHGVTECSC